ncbi:MAG: hypothetical protein ACQEP8_00970 [Chlamydiota bacterium]
MNPNSIGGDLSARYKRLEETQVNNIVNAPLQELDERVADVSHHLVESQVRFQDLSSTLKDKLFKAADKMEGGIWEALPGTAKVENPAVKAIRVARNLLANKCISMDDFQKIEKEIKSYCSRTGIPHMFKEKLAGRPDVLKLSKDLSLSDQLDILESSDPEAKAIEKLQEKKAIRADRAQELKARGKPLQRSLKVNSDMQALVKKKRIRLGQASALQFSDSKAISVGILSGTLRDILENNSNRFPGHIDKLKKAALSGGCEEVEVARNMLFADCINAKQFTAIIDEINSALEFYARNAEVTSLDEDIQFDRELSQEMKQKEEQPNGVNKEAEDEAIRRELKDLEDYFK